MARYVFITGGVVSSLGKGLASAALGALLQARGFSVRLRKLDPYLNVDPGTMSPYQHGEVFVTDDGAETDLDLGHYERFTGRPASQADNITTGASTSRSSPRSGAATISARTVQVIPHVTDAIKNFITSGNEGVDFVLCEIGGTVGDIEGPAVLRGDPPARQRAAARLDGLHPSHARAFHPERRRAQDQADAAFGQGAALDRHPARRSALPHRPAVAARRAAQDRAVLQRASRGGHSGARRVKHLRRAGRLSRRGARPRGARRLRHHQRA